MKRMLLRMCVFAVLLLGVAAGLRAFEPMRGYCPETPHDPTLWDGQATDWEEWAWAARFPDWFNDGNYPNAGFFYHEHKHGWTATSSSMNSRLYPGLVYFLVHDIEGEPPPSPFDMFRQLNSNDWNVAEFTLEGIEVKCWIFGGEDTENDTAWIKLSDGLQDSHLIPEVGDDNLINDAEGSFIVRVYDDPTTDVHWFPGGPEPGDPDWNWSDYYGVFGSFGFNNSFFSTGLDTRAGYEGDNEVYEWAFYWGHPGDETHPEPDTVFLPQGPASPALDSMDILVVIIDPPKDTLVYVAPNWWIHFWPPIPVPPFRVDCLPSQDIVMAYDDTVEVNYYIRNMGQGPDTYDATISDTKYWWLDPTDYDISLESEDWLILPVRVAYPFDCLTVIQQELVDTVIMTVQSQGDPGVVEAGSLTVTFQPVGIGESGFAPICDCFVQNTPNPFIAETTIAYQLPRAGKVKLKAYDASGRVVRVLVDEGQKSGLHVISWDGRSEAGKFVPAGVYFLKLHTDEYEATSRMIKLK